MKSEKKAKAEAKGRKIKRRQRRKEAVPELAEGRKNEPPLSAAHFALRSGGGKRGLRLLPFDKLRDPRSLRLLPFDKLRDPKLSLGLFLFARRSLLNTLPQAQMALPKKIVRNFKQHNLQVHMKEVTISSLRSRISYFFNLVANSSEVLIIPRTNTDDAVVILSLKEYNALTETNYLMSSEANRKRLLDSIHQLGKNDLIDYGNK